MTNYYLGATLLVRVLMLNAVDLEAVALQRASLGEALLAQIALVGPDAGVRPRVSLQVERVVETLAAERAQITLYVAVTLHVTIQQSLQAEGFAAHATREAAWIVVLLFIEEKKKTKFNIEFLIIHLVQSLLTFPGGGLADRSSSRVADACRWPSIANGFFIP